MKIGIDGGGTKTELILVDDAGMIVSRHLAPGCNPNVCGTDEARRIVSEALQALLESPNAPSRRPVISRTLLCMAGNRSFWREFAAGLTGLGEVEASDDSVPVLELATGGGAGLVMHGGTGSFVAARAPNATLHYAGGLGWRFGDAGSGYNLGCRAVTRTLLELQGWGSAGRLASAVCEHAGFNEEESLSRHYYSHPQPNRQIASLAPIVLRLAGEGDTTAAELVRASTGQLLELAVRVARQLFAGATLDNIPAGLTGPILTHPVVLPKLAASAPFMLRCVTEPPIEGVRRLLVRESK